MYFLLVPWSLRLSILPPLHAIFGMTKQSYSPIIDHTLVMFPLSSLAAAVAEAQSSHRLHCPYMSGAVAVIFQLPEGTRALGIVGKTRTVIRIRVRRGVIRVRIDETAIRIRIVVRTPDTATSEDFHLFRFHAHGSVSASRFRLPC